MLIAVAALIIVVLVPAAGGHLANIGRLRLRAVWLVCASLVVQIIIISIVDNAPAGLSRGVHIATYATLAIFIVANRDIPWMWVLGVGALANFLVISANGGVMPASKRALDVAGLQTKAGFNNSAPVSHARLGFLGDVFAIPKSLPLANVFSAGDVILLIGLILVVVAISRTAPDADVPYFRRVEDTAS